MKIKNENKKKNLEQKEASWRISILQRREERHKGNDN